MVHIKEIYSMPFFDFLYYQCAMYNNGAGKKEGKEEFANNI